MPKSYVDHSGPSRNGEGRRSVNLQALKECKVLSLPLVGPVALKSSLLLTTLLLIAPGAALGDTWGPPSTFDVQSANGEYRAQIEPGGRQIPPVVTVFEGEETIWTSSLTNRESPVAVMISNDGQFVVTLDNWGSVGYGDDVLVFYDHNGQIRKFSLEEFVGDAGTQTEDETSPMQTTYWRLRGLFTHSTSSRMWRDRSLMLFEGSGDSTTFGIWLDWAQQWFVWRLSDGMQIDVTGQVLEHWNAKGREWAREQLQLPVVADKPSSEVMHAWAEEAREWSRRHSARYEKKLTSCRYLAYLREVEDRELLEQALRSTETNSIGRMTLRANADRALAIHDGIAEDFQSFDRSSEAIEEYHFLGEIQLTIRLPEQPAGDGQVYVSFFPETVARDEWQTAEPEYRTGTNFRSSSTRDYDATFELETRLILPGRYWVMVVWDRNPPFRHNLYGLEGMRDWRESRGPAPTAGEDDFESHEVIVFEVKAGETTSVTVDCDLPGTPLAALDSDPPPVDPVSPGSPPALLVAPFDSDAASAAQSEWANYLNSPVEVTNLIGDGFTLIPPGEFLMGSPDDEAGRQSIEDP